MHLVKSLNQQSLLSISCATALTMTMTVLPLLLPVVALGALLVLEPPELVGESNASATHYWFPTDMHGGGTCTEWGVRC
jgi:hypothetical protein